MASPGAAPSPPARTLTLTLMALVCFASNSVLSRLALGPELMDAASFSSVRVLSAALILAAVVFLRRRRMPGLSYASWRSTAALFIYVIFFTFAYLKLAAGTGALILFGLVQITMFAVAFREGERFGAVSWVGLLLAIAGLIWLVSPGVTAPDLAGSLLMAVAGVAWGAYTLLGRGADHPVELNAANFLCCVPPVLAVNLAFAGDFHAEAQGVWLAVASGAIASGLGYAIWYAALRGLTATRAATVQLAAPVIAAIGGVMLLSEPLTLRLALSSAAVLGGIAIVLTQRASPRNAAPVD
ncbi:MAG: DMT family transporter [Hyphomicrobiales bacterium]